MTSKPAIMASIDRSIDPSASRACGNSTNMATPSINPDTKLRINCDRRWVKRTNIGSQPPARAARMAKLQFKTSQSVGDIPAPRGLARIDEPNQSIKRPNGPDAQMVRRNCPADVPPVVQSKSIRYAIAKQPPDRDRRAGVAEKVCCNCLPSNEIGYNAGHCSKCFGAGLPRKAGLEGPAFDGLVIVGSEGRCAGAHDTKTPLARNGTLL